VGRQVVVKLVSSIEEVCPRLVYDAPTT